jgi:hypothetical protein
MKRLFRVTGLLLLAFTMLAIPVGGEGNIQVLSSTADPTFAENIIFRLQAESSSPITEVILFYRDTLEAATNRAYPESTPGKSVDAQYTWDLLPGEVPVGAEIKFYWLIKNAAGDELKTEPQFFNYDDERFPWKKLDADKVGLFYYGATKAQAQHLLDVATAALTRISQQIGVEPERPIKIYVYNSKEDMSDALVSRSVTYDAFTTTLGVVISDDTLLLLGPASGVEQTTTHELTHVVVGEATDNPFHAPIPRWLDEGLAMYNEGSLPAYNQQALDEGILTDSLISVRSLSAYTGDPGLVDLFYGQSFSIVEYLLNTSGRDKMVELLGVFERGSHQEDALQEVFEFGLEELDARWREYVGAQPRPVDTAPTGATTA